MGLSGPQRLEFELEIMRDDAHPDPDAPRARNSREMRRRWTENEI